MGFKEDLMKQYRQWKEDPTPFLKGEVVIFKIIEENEKIEELKSQLASNHSYAQHVADDLGWYDRSELRKSMLDNLYKIIGDYPHPYIERLEKQLEGKE